ncbi:putative ubiquitin-conjugating enzyme E2 38 [Cynara cardunculus var. scolymus]|uniref:putative ubiquitin-conjugating enzyme E2 38 n=1 Tax=Cynara cardunculus var. scolymus TaxID=59895 RepID=UPI000D62CE00|nr:putative ubiquitin-conjugating enzyme E2 38 [Cynara cardunculus var. scolymus]XP_024987715.1 putative ubiquitin-conjugating enzyme E2 38 [Cynara cardunculus var. scolymus]XP_024987716.1 putative ubiquitin-conjugating enzyme E2 38 [Cynara cardunculus var. scolymus]XP_024987718.1 putative ubiquitin-conjugating enzyme E2 38 [Cynara cardunculus var. scolymus]
MEVGIEGLDSDVSILKKVKHDEEISNPTSEAGSSVSLSSGNINSDTSYHDDDNDDDDDGDDDGDDMVDEEDDAFDYDDDGDYMFENIEEDDEEAHYLSMQAQFDNVDLPPGVEASFSWLKDPVPSTSMTASLSNLAPMVPQVLSTGAEILENPCLPMNKGKDVASSSSTVHQNPVPSSAKNKEEVAENELKKKFEEFKLFDTVDDVSDHHFNCAGFQGQQPSRSWTKKIQDEWKILEKDLPDTIFVRAYETRMDLLRAVIIGPAGTPYHDGLFVFDVHFPPNYPDIPPMVYYYSGGLRLNPNLYDCGKVCLSLLNTWTGKGNEKWMPNKSTMLQVLVSIQALILNANPFFNEPGYDNMYPGAEGEKKSKAYNEEIFILSLKTMMYTLRRPPKHFEDLVGGHFRSRAHCILLACKAYMEGAPVGSITDEKIPNEKSGSKSFKAAVAKLMNGLISNFSRYGVTNCDQYRV